MSGINIGVVFSVCRMKTTFKSKDGDIIPASGTGFWLEDEAKKPIFITNKHNIDPTLKIKNSTDLEVTSIKIELREQNGKDVGAVTKFFTIKNRDNIYSSPDADVAIIKNPDFGEIGNFKCWPMGKTKDLATNEFFRDKVGIMDLASFIGYPGDSQSEWWDEDWNLGIARMVNIASVPWIPFTHWDITTKDVTLVSGLSFAGSSGSVVILHEKDIKRGCGFFKSSYVPPKIIGIMSGHWKEREIPQMFNHTGLSYYTRSTAIIELLRSI